MLILFSSFFSCLRSVFEALMVVDVFHPPLVLFTGIFDSVHNGSAGG